MNPIIKNFLESTKNACYCLPEKCIHVEKKINNIDTWLKKYVKLNKKNKQGVVYKAYIENVGDVIIKKISFKHWFLGKNEVKCGFYLNYLQSVFFAKILGYFFSEKNMFIISKFEEGFTLKEVINKLSLNEFIEIVLQLCIALDLAQEKYNFTHHDLHTDNVILKKVAQSYSLFDEYDCRFKNTFLPTIIDYGMSYLEKEEDYIAPCFKKMILNCCQPGFDTYTFFLFCSNDLKKNSNIEVQNFLKFILKNFFNDSYNYVSVLKKGANLKTPKELFNYIILNYSLKSVLFRNRLTIKWYPSTNFNKKSFVDSVYNKKNIKTFSKEKIKTMIEYDINSDEPLKKLIEKYFKIKYLKLTKIKEYKEWENNFYPTFKKYWKEKIITDQKNRCQKLLTIKLPQ